MAIRILIADGLDMFRELLKRLLESQPDFTVVADTGDGEALDALVGECAPDILVCDLKLRRRSGIDVLQEIAARYPCVKPIVLTDTIDEGRVFQVLLRGAHGLVMKSVPASVLFKSIRTVMAGQYWVSREEVSGLIEYMRAFALSVERGRPHPVHVLTSRQRQIVKSIAAGCSNREIAEALDISERAVKYHLTQLFGMFGVSGRMELARVILSATELTPASKK
jgi:DNA-binding NarL/FixJ family response regulator